MGASARGKDGDMARISEKRLLVKIARMYYERDMTQARIAARFGMSRYKVQRLLKKCRKTGVVHILIRPAPGEFADLEKGIEEKYGLRDAVVIETPPSNKLPAVTRELGAAAAEYLCGAIQSNERIAVGIGTAVYETVNALQHRARPRVKGMEVVQGFGGLGDANYEEHVTVLTQRLAAWLGAYGFIMPAPLVVGSPAVRKVLYEDPGISGVLNRARSATLALVGMGAIKAWPRKSGPAIIRRYPELADMPALGAVGDINLRFFDRQGRAVQSDFDARMVGLSLAELKSINMVVAVAGGRVKFEAIQAALKGGLLSVLVTDSMTAERLIEA